MSDLQLDLAAAILRIEQAYAERGTPLGDILLERLQSDARRLRTHLDPEWRARLEDERQHPTPTSEVELLTEAEHRAVALAADLWNVLAVDVIALGRSRNGDLDELRHHIHAIQQAVLSQAAARAYPDRYRLLGGELAPDLAQPVDDSEALEAARANVDARRRSLFAQPHSSACICRDCTDRDLADQQPGGDRG